MLYKNIVALGIACALLALVMSSTSPVEFSAPLLMAVFGLMYVALSLLFLLVLQIARRLAMISYDNLKMIRIAMIGSVLPVFMLLLHSIGQLTLRDVSLSLAFFGLLYFYFNRSSAKVRT